MFCPQCGQLQSSESARFCARCGFPLDGVIHLLHNRGMLPAYSVEGPNEISPRKRGVKQGGILLLTGIILVPILGVIASFSSAAFLEVLTAVAAIICFLGGPIRMLYAALFEEGAPPRPYLPAAGYAPPPAPVRTIMPPRNIGTLPPPPVNPTGGWKPRPTTAELAQPPSVTENTTRLLDKEEQNRKS